MQEVVKILMWRDGLSKEEAVSLIQETRSACEAAMAEGRTEEVEDIFTEMLGLEPDYIPDVLF